MGTIEKSLDVEFYIECVATDTVGESKNRSEIECDWKSTRDNPFPNWDYHHVWIVLDGSGYVETTFGNFHVKKGYVYYIPGSTILCSRCKDFMCQHYIDFIPTKNKFLFENFIQFTHVSNKFDEINTLMTRVEENYRNNGEASAFIANACLTAIMSYFTVKRFVPNKPASILQPSLEYIHNNLKNTENLKVEKLARDMSYSTKHYSRLFKAAYGTSPSEYILNKRLEYSRFLILNTNKPINLIAVECGFTDPMYFSRLFHKKFGVPPLTFRKKTI